MAIRARLERLEREEPAGAAFVLPGDPPIEVRGLTLEDLVAGSYPKNPANKPQQATEGDLNR